MIKRKRWISAKKVFWASNRFDLVFKLKTLVDTEGFRHNQKIFMEHYIQHIRAFNNFYEEFPRKTSQDDFLSSFRKNFHHIKNNRFILKKSEIGINSRYQLLDGAHRAAICTYLNLPIFGAITEGNSEFDYVYFQKRRLKEATADLHALFYVQQNPSVTIGILHSAVNLRNEKDVDQILQKERGIFYKKEIHLNFNGYVNMKKVSYGPETNGMSWIGNEDNGYAGARQHAKQSFGKFPIRMYVLGCRASAMIQAKKKIRDLCGIGNFSFHTTETKEEALLVAETFLNPNTKKFYETFPHKKNLFAKIGRLKKIGATLKRHKIDCNDICLVGSVPLELFGIRKAKDLDFIALKKRPRLFRQGLLSHHSSELSYYDDVGGIVYRPRFHLQIAGVKVICLKKLLKFKLTRREFPKDFMDIIKIILFMIIKGRIV